MTINVQKFTQRNFLDHIFFLDSLNYENPNIYSFWTNNMNQFYVSMRVDEELQSVITFTIEEAKAIHAKLDQFLTDKTQGILPQPDLLSMGM